MNNNMIPNYAIIIIWCAFRSYFFFIVFSSPISFHSFHCGFLLLVTLCAANKPCSVWNAANCGCRFTRALNLHIGHSSNIDGRIEVAAAVHYNATITLLCIFDECIQTKIHTNTQFLAAKYMKSRLEGDHISLLSIDNSSTYFIWCIIVYMCVHSSLYMYIKLYIYICVYYRESWRSVFNFGLWSNRTHNRFPSRFKQNV